MSTDVKGFRPADEKWKRMKAIYDNCQKEDIAPPDEVEKFFDGCDPGDEPGMEVDIKDAVTELQEEGRDGFAVDIRKLPKDVNIVWFYNSW